MAYHIGKYQFETEEDYKAGKRDAKKILLFRSVKGTELERCHSILRIIKKQNIQFESCLGEDFLKQLEAYIEKNPQPIGPLTRGARFIKKHRKGLNYGKTAVLLLIAVILSSQFLSIPANAVKSYLSFYEMQQKKQLVQDALKNARKLPSETKASQPEASALARTDEQLPASASPKAPETPAAVVKTVLPEYKSLRKQNGDFVGWLSIENTSIDYPVMYKEEDSNFYLSHNFEKQEDINGLLTLDERCSLDDKGGQHIIYGHNMRSGAMFGELLNYKNQSFYKDNKIICFDTLFEKNTYEIIAVFLSQRYYEDDDTFKFYNYIQFSSKEEFDYFYDNIKQMSLYPIDAAASYGDTLLSLVTCEYSQDNGRFVVIAKKTE